MNVKKAEEDAKKNLKKDKTAEARQVDATPSNMFFQYNTSLGPPFHVLIDTNFINFSIKNKLDIVRSMMDCLLAKCTPYITDCVMAELEKLGSQFRVALKLAKDPRMQRLPCTHKGTYADDCIVNRVTQHRCYIVATCDKDLRRRIRKVREQGVELRGRVRVWEGRSAALATERACIRSGYRDSAYFGGGDLGPSAGNS